MKMRKLLSLVLSCVMLLSISTVVSAKTPSPVDENPTFYVEVFNVANNNAILSVKFHIDGDLPGMTEYTEDWENYTYTGRGLNLCSVEVIPNSTYFGTITRVVTGTAKVVSGDGSNLAKLVASANSAAEWITGNDFELGKVIVPLKDTTMTKETLATKTDLVSYNAASVIVGEFPAAGAAGSSINDYQYYTLYDAKGGMSADGQTVTSYLPKFKCGASTVEAISSWIGIGEATYGSSGTKIYWNVGVSADVMNNGMTAKLINTNESASVKESDTFNLSTSGVYSGDGDFFFNVYSNLQSRTYIADTELEITSGNVTARN